jgi:phosphatidylinositol-bisphosphatase
MAPVKEPTTPPPPGPGPGAGLYDWGGEELPRIGPQPDQKLRIFCGVWNLHGKSPPEDVSAFVPTHIKHHVYVIGTCECERSIGASFVFASKTKWEEQIQRHLGQEYLMTGSHTLNAIHVMVLIHQSVWKYCWDIRTAQVATGFANFVGNKGGTQVGFRVGRTSLLFTNAHLAAHQSKMKDRTAGFARILQESPLRRTKDKSGGAYVKHTGVHEEYDRVFFMGDLNPRLNATREDVDRWLADTDRISGHASCLERDQLLPLLKADSEIENVDVEDSLWAYFKEQKIEFPPTYKFDKDSDNYDSSGKQRVPSWTDRILWKCDDNIRPFTYDSVRSVKCSDHRPVFAQFEANVDLERWEGPTNEKQSSVCSIQ